MSILKQVSRLRCALCLKWVRDHDGQQSSGGVQKKGLPEINRRWQFLAAGFYSLYFLRIFSSHESSPTAQLLYQEYSDVVLNKEIQSQQRLDSLAEGPGISSPRHRRKAMVPSDSYLQRLSMASSGSLWQEIPVVRNSTVLLSMTHEDQKLQEVPPRAGQRRGNKVIFANVLSPHLCHQEQAVPAPCSPVYTVTAHCHAEECELLSESGHFPHFPYSSYAICSYL